MPKPLLTPIGQLPERYGIKRSAIYGRMTALGLRPTKVKRKAFVTAADVQQLDAFAAHLKAGGTINNFELEAADADDIDPATLDEEDGGQPDLAAVDEAAAIDLTPSANLVSASQVPASQTEKLATLLDIILRRQPLTPSIQDLTARLELLEKAATHKWLLPTPELAEAVGLSPQAIGTHSKFERYGFRFVKLEQQGLEQQGAATAWRVTKLAGKSKKKSKH